MDAARAAGDATAAPKFSFDLFFCDPAGQTEHFLKSFRFNTHILLVESPWRVFRKGRLNLEGDWMNYLSVAHSSGPIRIVTAQCYTPQFLIKLLLQSGLERKHVYLNEKPSVLHLCFSFNMKMF